MTHGTPEPLPLPGDWAGWSLDAGHSPMSNGTREGLASLIRSLVADARVQPGTEVATFLLADELHRGGATRMLSQHVQRWQPRVGLAIWPEREAPRVSTQEDFTEIEHDAEPLETVHQALRVGPDDASAMHAWEHFWGTGTTTLIVADRPIPQMLDTMRTQALTRIQDRTFQTFPFYLPHLSLHFLRSREEAATLDLWLPNTQLYVRESEEDRAVLVLAKTPMKKAVAAHLASFTTN